MFSLPIIVWSIFAILILLVLLLIGLLIKKSKEASEFKESLLKLRKSFENLDEQAKLIVKTDLELNKAQEELDRRLNSLNSLQRTSRLISTTLDEQEIFRRLDESLMMDLGFEKNLILIYSQHHQPQPKINRGFSEHDLQRILTALKTNTLLHDKIQQGSPVCSIDASPTERDWILETFEVPHFILVPILTKNGLTGLVFIGNPSHAAPITEGDEEMIAILANQIGQALENARLFEEVFRSSQLLEVKVQERTQQLAEALKEVQAISKTKSEFISAVSHELRTPLTSIKGYASILIAGKLGDIPEAVKKRLEKINLHSDSLVNLINDLLDISRIESGRAELTIRPCAIRPLIENVHDLLTPQMRGKNIQWICRLSQDTPQTIEMDSRQIERVFINLISNAIKFTPEKGTIQVSSSMNNQTVTFTVADTGIGIPEENLTRLFDEFYRVDNSINQNVKGTGLGLALVKKIIEAHHGTIHVTSKVNEGTAFHFCLPVHHAKNPETK